MPPIEVGPANAIGAIAARLTRTSGGEPVSGPRTTGPAKGEGESGIADLSATATSMAVQTASALAKDPAPVDIDRVQKIRKAVETGQYPLVPAKIADAMIAAGVMLRSPK